MDEKTTLVMGASLNAERYANKAVRMLRSYGHPVVAIGRHEGMIADVEVSRTIPEGVSPHTITLYLNAGNLAAWANELLELRPARIIFNPGAEDPALAAAAEARGIEVVEGCTLVMLSTGQY